MSINRVSCRLILCEIRIIVTYRLYNIIIYIQCRFGDGSVQETDDRRQTSFEDLY